MSSTRRFTFFCTIYTYPCVFSISIWSWKRSFFKLSCLTQLTFLNPWSWIILIINWRSTWCWSTYSIPICTIIITYLSIWSIFPFWRCWITCFIMFFTINPSIFRPISSSVPLSVSTSILSKLTFIWSCILYTIGTSPCKF